MNTRTAIVILMSLGALVLVGQRAARTFRPPRTAVVDISEVFVGYLKKQDRQKDLTNESRGIQSKFEALQTKLKEITADVKLMQPGQRRNEKLLDKAKLEIEVKELENKEVLRLQQTQVMFLREIKAEITSEIEIYAQAFDLDLVIEKTVNAEGDPRGGMSFQWPIVHFAKPEIDITDQIVRRLNERYEKVR
jgi:Skp family chaperone for outer membrane proteins